MQLISCSRFPPVAQATLWIGVYKDHGTSLGGFNGQVAGEVWFCRHHLSTQQMRIYPFT